MLSDTIIGLRYYRAYIGIYTWIKINASMWSRLGKIGYYRGLNLVELSASYIVQHKGEQLGLYLCLFTN